MSNPIPPVVYEIWDKLKEYDAPPPTARSLAVGPLAELSVLALSLRAVGIDCQCLVRYLEVKDKKTFDSVAVQVSTVLDVGGTLMTPYGPCNWDELQENITKKYGDSWCRQNKFCAPKDMLVSWIDPPSLTAPIHPPTAECVSKAISIAQACVAQAQKEVIQQSLGPSQGTLSRPAKF